MNEPGYEKLADVLQRAFEQAAKGKGKERHADGEPFHEQVMQIGARKFGVGSLLFQAFKKSEESQRLPLDRGVNELLGAIVYLAGAVIAREADKEDAQPYVVPQAAIDVIMGNPPFAPTPCCGQHDTCSQPCVPREQARAGADGWIAWTGGVCPVPGGVDVKIILRDGGIGCGEAQYLGWRHDGPLHKNGGSDIIAYKIVEPARG